ncbi:MAG: hypothetical protein WAM28_08060 [Chlamydiales bacterium]
MRNKVLVVEMDPKEQRELEMMLLEVAEEGGELFFAQNRESGLEILNKELPQLVFLDFALIGENEEEWIHEGVRIVLMCHRDDPYPKDKDVMLKPLKARQVLEKCRAVLNREPPSPIPPI